MRKTPAAKMIKIKSKRKENMTELSEEQKKLIIETTKENEIIYEKKLLLKEVSLKEIKSLINNGIIVQIICCLS